MERIFRPKVDPESKRLWDELKSSPETKQRLAKYDRLMKRLQRAAKKKKR